VNGRKKQKEPKEGRGPWAENGNGFLFSPFFVSFGNSISNAFARHQSVQPPQDDCLVVTHILLFRPRVGPSLKFIE